MEGNEEKRAQSWWSTLPGIITAIATLITAVGGLIVILKSSGAFDKKAKTAETIIPDPNKNEPFNALQQRETIHLQSKLIIRYPYSYDLDAGVPYNSDSNADVDFRWEHPTSMDFEMRPDLGKFCLIGKKDFDNITLEELEKLQYSKDPIDSDLLLKGTVVAYITKEKRFGKFIVEEDGLEPTISSVTYERE